MLQKTHGRPAMCSETPSINFAMSLPNPDANDGIFGDVLLSGNIASRRVIIPLNEGAAKL